MIMQVDIPITKCICKDTQGQNFRRYVLDTCLPKAPLHSKNTILTLLDSSSFASSSPATVCSNLVDLTTTKLSNSLAPFFEQQFLSAENVGSALDYLLRIGSQADPTKQDLCTNYQTNPFVVAIVPEPIDYFRACGLTSVCRTRCRAEIEAFEAANTNPSITSQTYTVRTNSPFFLELDEGAITPMTILAITELSDCEAVCGVRLPSERETRPDKCVAIAGVEGDESDLTVMTYCVPSLPGAGVRKAETWVVLGTVSIMNQVTIVKFLDFERGEKLLVVRDVVPSDESNQNQKFESSIELFTKAQFSSSEAAWTPEGGSSPPLVDEAYIVSSLYVPPGTVMQLRRINSVLVSPVSQYISQYIYMEVMAVYASDAAITTKRINICGPLVQQEWSITECSPSLWDETDRGHPIFLSSNSLVIVPGGSMLTTSDGNLVFFNISQFGNVVGKYTRPFQSATWALTSGIPSSAFSSSSSSSSALDFISSSKAIVKKAGQMSPIGGVAEWYSGKPIAIKIFMSNNPSSPTHWLSQVRINVPVAQEEKVTANSYMSLEVQSDFELRQKCNYQTCNGCIDLNVQRLCYGAQQCTIAKCIGTLTNQNRPLCGLGQTGQALFMTVISMTQAGWTVFAETVGTLLDLTLKDAEEAKKNIQIKWIDDSFFSVMCSAKDATASFVSILTSTINFVVLSVTKKPVAYLEVGAQRVDSNFQAMFTMITTSFNNLINQIMLGFFYAMFALQKVIVCELNTAVALLDWTGINVTIGIPEIQVIPCSLFLFSEKR
jgi:hypothetical protein